MKGAIVLLIVISTGLGWKLVAELESSAQLRSQIVELTVKLNDKLKFELLERQRACSSQADKLLRQLGFDMATAMVVSQNHFNSKIDKCFLSVSNTVIGEGRARKFRFLIDAYEQRGYADFGIDIVVGEKRAPSCLLTPPGEHSRNCASEDEYQAFVARYME